MDIWFYSLYPLLATFCCVALLRQLVNAGTSAVYIKLFSNLAALNFLQMLAYAFVTHHFELATYLADTYLIAAYFLFAHFMQLALHLGAKDRRRWFNWLYVPPVLLTLLHVSGLMVESYRLENNTLLHNDGRYAIAFDLFVISSATLTALTFFVNLHHIQRNYLQESRNIIAVIAFLPFLLAAIALVILSNTRYVISVVVVVPSMSLYMVMVFFYIRRLNHY